MNYYDTLMLACEQLAEKGDTLFVGQAVSVKGTGMSGQFSQISPDKLLEFPVAENFQAGFCIGMILRGMRPICVIPRLNFLYCAHDAIFNGINRLPELVGNKKGMIIKVAVPTTSPLNPGPQHSDSDLRPYQFLDNVELVRLLDKNYILDAYSHAYNRQDGKSTILVEFAELYNS